MKERIKKAQVTAFIIIAILIIAGVATFLTLRTNLLNPEEERVDPTILPVYSFIEGCVKQTTSDAVYYIGQTGGYFESPALSTENNVAYYLYEGANYIPLKERIEKELSLYVDNMLFFCVKDFNEFPDFEVKQEDIKTIAKIEDGQVVFNIAYPITISKNEKNYYFKNFKNIEVPVRLGVVYDMAYEMMQEQMKNKIDVCISCIYKLADEKDLYIEMFDYDEKTVIFTILDQNSKVNDEDFRFYFANRY